MITVSLQDIKKNTKKAGEMVYGEQDMSSLMT